MRRTRDHPPRPALLSRHGLRWLAKLAALGGISLLQGCLSIERPTAEPEIPAHYRELPARNRGARPALDWWTSFGSGELTLLIERAQLENFDVRAAIARVLQADAQARIAGAPLFPQIDTNPSVTRSRASQAGLAGASGGGSETSVIRIPFSASYEIDFWGKNRALSLAAQQTAVASRFDRETVGITVTVNVANAYFQVLGAQDRIRIANENLASATRILDVIRSRIEVGTATALDIAQQETIVAGVRAGIPLLEQQLRQNRNTLGLLVGSAPEFLAVRGGTLAGIRRLRISPGLPSELLLQRPDIRSAEAQLFAADANVYAARAAFFPSISLTGQGGVQSSALNTLFTPQAAFYSVGASLAQPIFDGGRLLGQFEQQKGRQLELLQNYRKAVISGFTDVENALVAVAELSRREQLQAEAVVSARRAAELSETRLREGTVDIVTVLNTQQTLFSAQDTLAQIQLARILAAVSLYQALGGGWVPDPGVTLRGR